MWQPGERNFEKIQFEKLRKKIDGVFNKAHDELSDCYYNFWRKEKSKPFKGYDVQSSPEESKVLFDKLHGLIFHLRYLKFHQENLKEPAEFKIPEEKYNLYFNLKGKIIRKRNDEAVKQINGLKGQGIELTI